MKLHPRAVRALLVPAAVLGALAWPSAASAAAISWDGGGDGVSWSDGGNWSGNVVPASGDAVAINGANVTADVDVEAESVAVTGTATITQSVGTLLSLDYAGPNGPGQLALGVNAVWHQLGAFGADVDIAGAGTFQLDHPSPFVPMDFMVQPGARVVQLRDVEMENGVYATIGGDWNANGHDLTLGTLVGGSVNLAATGVLRTSTGASNVHVPLEEVHGTLRAAAASSLVLRGDNAYYDGARLDVPAASSVLEIAAGTHAISNFGSNDIAATGAGQVRLTGPSFNLRGRTLALDAGATPTAFAIDGGTLTGGGAITGGRVVAEGAALGSSGTYALSSTTQVELSDDVALAGTANVTVSGQLDLAGHSITDSAHTGLLTVAATGRLRSTTGATSTVAVDATNQGTVEAGGGAVIAFTAALANRVPASTLQDGTWIARAGSAIRLTDTAPISSLVDADVELHGTGAAIQASDSGDAIGTGGALAIDTDSSLLAADAGTPANHSIGRPVDVAGALQVDDQATLAITSLNVAAGGSAIVDGALAAAAASSSTVSGYLGGTGAVTAPGGTYTIASGGRIGGTLALPSTIVAGTLAPGDGPVVPGIGTIAVAGTLAFQATGVLATRIAGAASADQVAASGAVTIDPSATVVVDSTGFAAPSFGSSFALLTAGSFATADHFGTETLGALAPPRVYALQYGPTAVSATVPDTNPPVAPLATVVASHVAGAPSNDRAIDVSIAGASDAESGLGGYAVVADQSAATIPPASIAVADSGGVASWTSAALADGTWYVHVRAIDGVGNASTTVTFGPFPIDATAPATPAISGIPNGTSYLRTFQAAFGNVDPDASLRCSLDGAAATACASPLQLTDVPIGSHELRVTAVDAAGNESAAATAAWRVVPVPTPPLAPAPKDVRILQNTGHFAALARVPSLRIGVPVRQSGVQVRAWLVISADAARALGLTVADDATRVVLGTSVRRSKAAGTLQVNIRLTPRARALMRRLAKPGSTVKVVPVQARLALSRGTKRSTVFVPLRLRP